MRSPSRIYKTLADNLGIYLRVRLSLILIVGVYLKSNWATRLSDKMQRFGRARILHTFIYNNMLYIIYRYITNVYGRYIP